MKSVIFCGSSKFMTEMKDWGDYLEAHGVDAFIPEDFSHDPAWSGTKAEQRAIATRLTWDHFSRIPQYDVVFIYNKDGYSGTSTTLEIGYACGSKKEVYALSPDGTEICRDVLFANVCPTREELLAALQV